MVATAVRRAASPLRDRPLPVPIPVTNLVPGAVLSDPTFTALPGARVRYGTLGGATYQIEVPDRWNGRLVMWMHGFEELAPVAHTGPPDFRRYLIAHGFAWAASSFSSTSLIPSDAADETAALWDLFVRDVGRPRWTYVSGGSMGGWATHIAAERYGNRFDGALGLCGAVGTTPGLRISSDAFVVGAYLAGVTQAEFDASDVVTLIDERIRPALADPREHQKFENIMIALTGGPRVFDRAGFALEEETNWRRAGLLIGAKLVPPGATQFRFGPTSPVTSQAFERRAVRLPTVLPAFRDFAAGMEVTGRLAMPLLTMHTTGDGQVPINQAQILHRRVHAAGRDRVLVQRVVEDPGHCGFSTGEQEAAFRALVGWVEHSRRPKGTSLDQPDLRRLDRTFELEPRPGTAKADHRRGTRTRVSLRGQARRDGAEFNTEWIGAVVVDGGLVTACNVTLPPVHAGRFSISVFGANESLGCGRRGAEIVLWTYLDSTKLFATTAIPWPTSRSIRADVNFEKENPLGAAPANVEFSGEVYRPDGRRVRTGARVEAYIDNTRCGIASTRSGVFMGYIMSVVGPETVAGCRAGASLEFRVDGVPAVETRTNSPGQSSQLDLTVR